VPRLRFSSTPFNGLMRVQRQRLDDPRGFFSRVFCADEFREAGFAMPVAQVNQTFTRRCGAVRGLHFQRPPHAEDKFITCLRGQVHDVAVDLRRESATYLQWHAETLSADNGLSLLIPKGFAHGFQALSNDCELLYVHSVAYNADAEGALNVRDPAIGIRWPLDITELSERDARHPLMTSAFTGF